MKSPPNGGAFLFQCSTKKPLATDQRHPGEMYRSENISAPVTNSRRARPMSTASTFGSVNGTLPTLPMRYTRH